MSYQPKPLSKSTYIENQYTHEISPRWHLEMEDGVRVLSNPPKGQDVSSRYLNTQRTHFQPLTPFYCTIDMFYIGFMCKNTIWPWVTQDPQWGYVATLRSSPKKILQFFFQKLPGFGRLRTHKKHPESLNKKKLIFFELWTKKHRNFPKMALFSRDKNFFYHIYMYI